MCSESALCLKVSSHILFAGSAYLEAYEFDFRCEISLVI